MYPMGTSSSKSNDPRLINQLARSSSLNEVAASFFAFNVGRHKKRAYRCVSNDISDRLWIIVKLLTSSYTHSQEHFLNSLIRWSQTYGVRLSRIEIGIQFFL